MNETQINTSFHIDKDVPPLNLQNYHPSLIDSYREKFLLSHEQKLADANFLHKLNPAVFSLNTLHSQYSKSINLSSLHDSLSRVQSSIDEQQHQQQQQMRVKNLYSLTNESVSKVHQQEQQLADAQNSSFKSHNSNVLSNDKNNNKNLNFKDKNDTQFEQPTITEKSSHIIHLNTKTGVSLKCAYCEAREDFKSR